MIVYSLTSSGQFGAARYGQPDYPVVAPRSPSVYPGAPPPPPPPKTWTQDMSVQPGDTAVTSPTNTSGDANNDFNDEWGGGGLTPGTAVPGMTPSTSPEVNPNFSTEGGQPTFAPEIAPTARRVALSPIGIMAVGAALVGLWAAFRKH